MLPNIKRHRTLDTGARTQASTGTRIDRSRTVRRIVVLAVLAAAFTGVVVPAANADGGTSLCIGCSTALPTGSSGSGSICLDSFACPHWSSYQGYQFWGPISHQTMWSGPNYYLVFSYWVYDSSRQVFQGNSACWYLANVIFRGCFWF